MIRSIHHLITARSEQEYGALREFFSQLGLPLDQSWEGERSRGAKFHAPEAGVEVGYGRGFPQAQLVIEVSDADAVYDVAQRKKIKILEQIADTEWDARMFILQGPAGSPIAIFSYLQPPEERNELQNELRAAGRRFAIVVSRFNSFITERLLAGAQQGLRQTGARHEDITIVRVPGSFEIPAAARELALTKKYDAIICLGCLLRGDTAHYDVIANEVTRGIGQSNQETGVPHAFGVLTCDTLEQAIDRAGLKSGNKGWDAALAAVEMASLKEAISTQQPALNQGRGVGRSKKILVSARNDTRSSRRTTRSSQKKK